MTETKPKTVLERLSIVQKELKAPKGQRNDFGKYNYRSCEDIMEAVKPLLVEHGLALIVSDELVNVGDRYYIKAEARVQNIEGEGKVIVYGWARESLDKKGMDEAQITGAASSYARKYSLNGLFLIDDTKDADTNEHKEQAENKAEDEKPWFNDYNSKTETWNDETYDKLLDMAHNGKTPDEILKAVQKKYKVSKAAQEAIKTLTK